MHQNNMRMRWTVLLIFFIPFGVAAQKMPLVEEKIAGFKKLPGFFNLYWDEVQGKIWMEVDKPDTEVLYASSLPAGLGSNDIGLDRGRLGSSKIVKFAKTGRKLMMIQPNYEYRAVTGDAPEKRAVEQSFAQSTIWGFNIEAETGNHYLVDATDFLLRDALMVGPTLRRMRQGSFSFDKSRSAIYLNGTKNFPLNTEIEATITLISAEGDAGNFLRAVTPSPESVTLRMHHSFVQLPDSNYKPRVFDPRSSFIPVSFFDFSTPVTEPIEKQFVMRHRLQKKNPAEE
ncbi:MAG: DUF5117 domain-containing protein, partial [Chitinophagaceae bacterium]